VNNKTLYLIRHAKSSWHNDLRDHDRPINERGIHDASMMGMRLVHQGVAPEIIISSSATRAQMTSQLIAQEIGYKKEAIKVNPEIYGVSSKGLIESIHQFDNTLNKIMLVGHNPVITETVNWLTGSKIENIPTCGVTILGVSSSSSWRDFSKESVDLIHYDYPKNG